MQQTLKVPICVQPISSSADSNTRRTGTAWMRFRSHSTCRAQLAWFPY